MMIDIPAVPNSEILFVDSGVLLLHSNNIKSWYNKLIYNLLILSTNKNLTWLNRIFCLKVFVQE